MPNALTGKVAIVTGSSRGIGKAIAKGFASEGAEVIVTGRSTGSTDPEALTVDRTVREIEEAGGRALALRCDVTSEADVNAMVASAVERYGRVDVLVNNAGVLWRPGLLETAAAKWNEILRTNLDGPYYGIKAVLPQMMERRSGSIISITSGRANTDDGESTAYAAGKSGLDRLTIKLATEVKEYGIAVNALDPGATFTERLMASNPEVAAKRQRTEDKNIVIGCIWLASQAAGAGFTGRVVDEKEFGDTWP